MYIVVLQPYVPQYRVPLFKAIERVLQRSGGKLAVLTSSPRGLAAGRADAGTGDWAEEVRSWSSATPLGELKLRAVSTERLRSADACVLELDAGNLNAWLAALDWRVRRKLFLWGHGKNYTGPERKAAELAKLRQAKLARGVLTYAQGGRDYLIARGLPAAKVECIGNATDTLELRRHIAARTRIAKHLSDVFEGDFSRRLPALYLGSLDRDKRVGFLAGAAAHAFSKDKRFVLLVCGSGYDSHLLRAGITDGYIRHKPEASRSDLADLAGFVRAIWMPGRVGLVAVDAIAMGLPVLTTAFPYHAPEVEYLIPDSEIFNLPDEPARFAESALSQMASSEPGRYRSDEELPSVEKVAEEFVRSIGSRL